MSSESDNRNYQQVILIAHFEIAFSPPKEQAVLIRDFDFESHML
jgi:hypothetical protein